MKTKFKFLIIPLIIACALFFVMGISTMFFAHAQPLNEDNMLGINVTLKERFCVGYKVSLPDGYQDPSMTFSVGGADTTVTDYTTDGNYLIFTFNGVDFADIDKTISANQYAKKKSFIEKL